MSETETGEAPTFDAMFAIIRLTVIPWNSYDATHYFNHDTSHTETLKTITAAKAAAIVAP